MMYFLQWKVLPYGFTAVLKEFFHVGMFASLFPRTTSRKVNYCWIYTSFVILVLKLIDAEVLIMVLIKEHCLKVVLHGNICFGVLSHEIQNILIIQYNTVAILPHKLNKTLTISILTPKFQIYEENSGINIALSNRDM